MTRRRAALWLVCPVALLALAGALGVLVLRSSWFRRELDARILGAIERSTGGRAEAEGFRFDWRRLRVEVDGFVLHGTEPAGKPPLLRADAVSAGLKIVSLARREADVQYVDVSSPRIYLIVYPDGRTNLPRPTVTSNRPPLESLVKLAIGRFRVTGGLLEVEGGSKTPFQISGRNLGAQFQYEPAVPGARPRYRGDLSVHPLEAVWNGRSVPVDLALSLGIEQNRIEISAARSGVGRSAVEFSGAVENPVSPRAWFHYKANAALEDIAGLTSLRGLQTGRVDAAGEARFSTPQQFSVNGAWHASGVEFRQGSTKIGKLRAEGKLEAGPANVHLSGIRLSAESALDGRQVPIEGQVASVLLRGQNADLRGLSFALLGGSFQGDATIGPAGVFGIRGEIGNIEAERAVALYARERLPWNSLVSGSINVAGTFRKGNDFHAGAALQLAAAPGGPPVSGELNAEYDARAGTLDLGMSSINLPSSRAVFSGSLGREIRAHIETRNLDDFLPVLGEGSSTVPLRLDSGSLVFDGTVTGKLDQPQIAGRLTVARFLALGEFFDSFAGTVNASPNNLEVRDASLARGSLRAQFQGSAEIHNWKIDNRTQVAGSVTIPSGSVADVLATLHRADVAATGVIHATAQLSGTLADPRAAGDLEISKGSFAAEPFDRVTAHVTYDGRQIDASSGQIAAGAKQIAFEGSFENNDVHLRVKTNAMPLDQISLLTRARPGVEGTVQATASGEVRLSGGKVLVNSIDADVLARGVQLAGQSLGDAHLTAVSQGPLLRTHFDSNIANSRVEGQGEWRMEGDYPGSAELTFSRLDLDELRNWLTRAGTPSPFEGFAEGQFRIDGPALKPDLLKGELRIANLQLGPASDGKAIPAAANLAFHNSGPIVATVTNSAINIDNALLVGRSTELTIGGRVLLNQKNPLDLRAKGRIDLSVLGDFSRDISSSGTATLEATGRGSFAVPQLGGRLAFENAAFNYSGLPNGLSNAAGVIVFAGDRATIQRLGGETGGGKIELTGFAEYTGGQGVFRLHADASSVRLRYPEGISTVANASLNFTGTTDRSMLAGNVTVLRSMLNLESDFGSLFTKSSEPVRLPAANTGFLGGMNFDVQIQSAPDIQIDSTLTQGLQADAVLRLRGTATNPALLGRVNISQGQLVFFGTKYSINQGSVSFYNPVKVEPVLDIDLQTKARGVEVTLTVAGPLNKLTVTPRSDPPLQFNEIVSLLATGSSPSTDSTIRVQQSALPPPAQESTASALLGQVIASPVTGRLQRFFGLSGIRIDPTLPGVEYNPQARLTLQQQVTPDVTFTYITNVTQANPQVVSMEWTVSKQWSVVAQREENGLLGLDFFFKRRFK
ncbi:MAG: translocation/assembly module TamB domain-containing protein [Acidobacteriia bacterium]|nr:translocation/assembly module TamB domain-containing protein [Terriglobia bacterium]